MNDKDKLAHLDDLVIADILSMSESELRSAVSEADVEAIKAGFEKAKTLLGKGKLGRAKAAVASYQGANVVVLRRGTPTADLGSLRREDREFDKKLTLAARNGGADVEADADGIEEDLAELDAWKEEDGKES
jgi:hypothetical protein